MAKPIYRVLIKDGSANLHEFEKAGEIIWERKENAVGRCQFLLPYTDAKLIATLGGGKDEIRIYRDDVLVWQGLLAIPLDTKEGTHFFGFDFLECLKWNIVGFDVNYAAKKIGSEIISPIWDAQDAKGNCALGDLITKGTIQDPYQTGTSTPKTITKRVYNETFFTLLQYLIALSRADSPSGAWTQNTVMEITRSESSPTFNFSRDVGSDKPEVRFELDSEVVDFEFLKDFRYIFNKIIGYGVDENPKTFTDTKQDATSQAACYLREISPYWRLATATSSLEEKVKDFLKKMKDPQKTVLVKLAEGSVPFNGYSMGDNIHLIIPRGRVSIDEFYRVIGMRVRYEAGAEFCVPMLERKRT